jgi:galactokinase
MAYARYPARASSLQPGQVFSCRTGNLFDLEIHSLEVSDGRVNIIGKHVVFAEFYRMSLPAFVEVTVRRRLWKV